MLCLKFCYMRLFIKVSNLKSKLLTCIVIGSLAVRRKKKRINLNANGNGKYIGQQHQYKERENIELTNIEKQRGPNTLILIIGLDG